jgi:2-polyprenyl-6-methoxyphenol hydroxylase-like FAD-dependent oxidoreductase
MDHMVTAPSVVRPDSQYDVIVVGARCAGSPTAMLLARKGYRVLLVDRATFPSDTLSTHQIQLPGVARLARWGLLDHVIAAGTPPTRHVRFDPGPVVLEGEYPAFEGIDALYSPRRTILDKILIDAAAEAGAEVREGFTVDELEVNDGRVTGIRGRSRGDAPVVETAQLVIGADGKHSVVAKSVSPGTYNEKSTRSFGYYTYWADVPVTGGEMYSRDQRLAGVWPTNDGLVLTYVASPVAEFHAFRADIEGNLLKTFDLCGDLGERIRAGSRAERFFGSADLPNVWRQAHGPGWALVGDAGLVMDPITGQGIGDAFRDAELLVDAIDAGLSGRKTLEGALGKYEQARYDAALPMYEFTTELASFGPPKPEQAILFSALIGNQHAIDRFFGVLTGAVPMREYFGPGNLVKLIGLRGMANIMLSKFRSPRPRSTVEDSPAGEQNQAPAA